MKAKELLRRGTGIFLALLLVISAAGSNAATVQAQSVEDQTESADASAVDDGTAEDASAVDDSAAEDTSAVDDGAAEDASAVDDNASEDASAVSDSASGIGIAAVSDEAEDTSDDENDTQIQTISAGDKISVTTTEWAQALYYQFIPTENGYYTFKLSEDDCDTYVYAYDSNWDSMKKYLYNYEVSIYAEAGNTYYFEFFSYEDAGFTCTVSLEQLAVSGSLGDDLTWDFTDGTLTISGTGDMPECGDRYDYPYYFLYDDVVSIVIEEGVTSVSYAAFGDYEYVTDISIAGTVTSIGAYAFYNAYQLTSVTVPSSVTQIGEYAFYNCYNLTFLYLPEGLTDIGASAFRNCDGLADEDGFVICNGILFDYTGSEADIEIPETVQIICGGAFINQTQLVSVAVPESVITIGDWAFSGCTGLASIEILNSDVVIGDAAFYGCEGLSDEDGFVIVNHVLYDYFGESMDVIIPDGVTVISRSAFEGNDIVSVVIPDSVTRVEDYAFNACTLLTTITLGTGVVWIGYWAFYQLYGLESVYYGGSSAAFYAIEHDSYNYYLFGCDNIYFAVETVEDTDGDDTDGDDADGDDADDDDADDDDDSGEKEITQITELNTAYTAQISAAGSCAYFSYTPSESGTYQFYSTGDYDTYAYFYDTDWNQLAYNDDYDEDLNARIEYELTAGETYYIAFKFLSSSTTGSFSVYANAVSIAGTEHTAAAAVKENVAAATCTTAGSYDSVVYCSTCGEEISRTTVTTAALGHNYSTSKITKAATCTTAGVRTYYCANDSSHTYTETIAATGHTYVNNVCSTCGALKSSTVASATVTLSKISYTYNGSARKPTPTVKVNGTTLKNGTDYTVSYSNNKNAGTATVTIKGKGSYSGTIKKTFTITRAARALTVRTSAKTVKYTKVKKAKQTVTALTVTNKVSRTITYKKSSGSKYLTVNSSTGKITVKKGTPKGTYKIKVKVTAKASTNYKSATKTVTVTVKVK